MPSSEDFLGVNPAVASRFLLEIDQVEIGIFKEVSGLEFEVEKVDIVEGGQNNYVLQVPSRIKWDNIKLSRGLTQSDALLEWIQKFSGDGFAGKGNKITRSTGAITAITHSGVRLRAWNMVGVMPLKWTGPKFSVGSMDALEEELEISHQGFKSETFPKPS
jgi:phage tail-like protein